MSDTTTHTIYGIFVGRHDGKPSGVCAKPFESMSEVDAFNEYLQSVSNYTDVVGVLGGDVSYRKSFETPKPSTYTFVRSGSNRYAKDQGSAVLTFTSDSEQAARQSLDAVVSVVGFWKLQSVRAA